MLIITSISGFAQVKVDIPDSILNRTTIVPKTDSLPKDDESLKSKVLYSSKDSIVLEVATQKVFLFGEAHVNYDGIDLTSHYIELSLKDKIIYAEGGTDSLGKAFGKPVFEENDQVITSETMRYNFDTKKGKITEVMTQDGDGYIHGKQVKLDSEDVLYIKNGKYTTCENPHPHFYINATKLKIIKDDKIVSGPANLVIEDIPTPLAIPFGFFPNKREQASGVVIPQYGESPGLGFFLQNGGYYFSINDYVDLAVLGSIYSRGSWEGRTESSYAKRYKFKGDVDLSYSEMRYSIPEFPDYSLSKNFFIKWRHEQDAKARPFSRFSADVNAGTANNYRNNLNSTTQDFLTNTFKSNVNFTQRIPNSAWNLAVTGNHSQNTRDSSITVTLPEVALTMSRVFPFKRKVMVGSERWYEKIGLNYSGNFRNTLNTKEKEFFTHSSFEKINNGIRHSIPVSTSIKMLKYLTLTPTATYNEKWYFKTTEKTWDADSQTLLVDTISGFSSTRDVSFNASITTKVYGMYQFRSQKVKAIRHVMTPSISGSYTPVIDKKAFQTVQNDSAGNTTDYSIYESSIFGGPNKLESGSVNFTLNNNIEMKVKSKKDTVSGFEKIKLLENLSLSTSYNFLADSMQLTPITFRGWTNLFKNVNLQFGGAFDPYAVDDNYARYNAFLLNTDGKLARLTTANSSISFKLKSKEKKAGAKTEKATEDELSYIRANPEQFIDFTVPWSASVAYNVVYTKTAAEPKVTNSISLRGDVSLTEKWKLEVNTGYDFVQKKLTLTSIDVYRDLHCWELSFTVVPFGTRKSYNVQLNVKSATLQDLKLTRKRSWYDYQ